MNESRISRLLAIYEDLHKGKVVNKKRYATQFVVSEKTIQRDIEDLRNFLANHYSIDSLIEYDKKKCGYVLYRDEHIWLTSQEVLLTAKVLLESRALTKYEMESLLDKLILQCAPEERKHVKEVILHERFHYNPTRYGKPLSQTIWHLSLAINRHKRIEIDYMKVGSNSIVKRVLEPQGIVFSEFYFYLIAFIHGFDYEFPAIYRLDHIQNYMILDEHFRVSESNPVIEKYKDGELRRRVQFMQTGRVLTVRFKFWGKSLEAVLDRLPTAHVIDYEGDISVIEAEVFGRGVKMWLLSQAQYLEVISPPEFREEMKQTICEMMELYQ